MRSVAAAINHLARHEAVSVKIILHTNPGAAEAMGKAVRQCDAVELVAALGHAEMIAAMRSSDLLLSDSGGVQEEAPALGVPLLVLRDATERPEGVASGNALLVGTETDRVVAAVTRLIADRAALAAMAIPRFPFGDGQSAPRIAALAIAWLDAQGQDARRPLST